MSETIENKLFFGIIKAIKSILEEKEFSVTERYDVYKLYVRIGNNLVLLNVRVPRGGVFNVFGHFRWKGLIRPIVNTVERTNIIRRRCGECRSMEQIFIELVKKDALDDIRDSIVFEPEILSTQCSQEFTDYIYSVRYSVLNTVFLSVNGFFPGLVGMILQYL
jgi:hypothetical protein